MSSSATRNTVTEIDLPVSEGAIVLSFLYVFVVFFVALAGYALFHFDSMPIFSLIASVLWLLFITMNVWFAIDDAHGVHQLIINHLGTFSSKQFVEAKQQTGEQLMICFGFEIFDRRFYYLLVEGNAIASVDWSTGQASNLAGEDMDDWSVALRYCPQEGSRNVTFPGIDKEKDVYIIGPAGAKKDTERLGRSFDAFLRSVGVEFDSVGEKQR